VVAVLGMAFKGESDDKRESLSYKLRKLLMVETREVLWTDPYVPNPKLVPLGEALRRAYFGEIDPFGDFDLFLAPPDITSRSWTFPSVTVNESTARPIFSAGGTGCCCSGWCCSRPEEFVLSRANRQDAPSS
jgi:hypothetical protein